MVVFGGPESVSPTHTLVVAPLVPLPWRQASDKLEFYTEGLRKAIQDTDNARPLYALVLALKATRETILRLNSDNLDIPVFWNNQTDLPDTAIIAADAGRYGRQQDVPVLLQAVLRSFSGWIFMGRETAMRYYRSSGQKNNGQSLASRVTSFDDMLNHEIRVLNGRLLFKQFIGVRSVDMASLADYFSFGQTSKVVDGLHIIYTYEAVLAWTDTDKKQPSVADIHVSCSDLFSRSRFENLLASLSIPPQD